MESGAAEASSQVAGTTQDKTEEVFDFDDETLLIIGEEPP